MQVCCEESAVRSAASFGNQIRLDSRSSGYPTTDAEQISVVATTSFVWLDGIAGDDRFDESLSLQPQFPHSQTVAFGLQQQPEEVFGWVLQQVVSIVLGEQQDSSTWAESTTEEFCSTLQLQFVELAV